MSPDATVAQLPLSWYSVAQLGRRLCKHNMFFQLLDILMVALLHTDTKKGVDKPQQCNTN